MRVVVVVGMGVAGDREVVWVAMLGHGMCG